jgi:periplasmic divalent cation tolerance protein
MTTLLVLTNVPDRAAAERIADLMVEQKLAACVNILAPCRSVYRWKGAVQHDEEHPVLFKTTYELPEIVAFRVERGLPAYLDWVAAETQPG